MAPKLGKNPFIAPFRTFEPRIYTERKGQQVHCFGVPGIIFLGEIRLPYASQRDPEARAKAQRTGPRFW